MARLYKRNAAVTLARPIAGQFFGELPNAIRVTDLRVSFEVERTLRSEPDSCRLSIYNLAERTRGEVEKTPLFVRLDAGYDGQFEELFSGDLRYGLSHHDEELWETALEVGDGERAHRFARVSRSFGAGIDTLTAVREVARSMGLTVRASPAALVELRSQYAAGLALAGPARNELDRLLGRHGMTWSIQSGRLQVLRAGEARADLAQVVSQDSGLIGSPEYGPPQKKGEPPVLHFQTLLRPGIVPGGRVQLNSSAIRGIFRVARVLHRGDTHGSEWVSEVEATTP